MSQKKTGAATNVMNMMSNLTTATEAASKIASTASSIYDIVSAVTQQSHNSLMELTKEAASIAKAEVSDFRDAMRDTNASGEDLRSRCLELREKWESFENYIYETFERKEISRTEVQNCIQLLQLMLESASNCGKCYKEFREKLNRAVDVGSRLAERCRVAAADSRSKASTTKAIGYGATGVLGAVALGFLTVATGGAAAVGAAAMGAAAAGAGAYTYDRAGKLEKLAGEFDDQRGKLDDALRDLNSLGDSITGLFTVTEKMVENMEIALRIFKEQERLKQENEDNRIKNEKMALENEKMKGEQETLKQEAERKKQENDEMKQQQESMRQRNEELEERLKKLEIEKNKKKSKACRNM